MKNVVLGVLVAAICLSVTPPAQAQVVAPAPVTAREEGSSGSVSLTASSADCSTAGSCATLKQSGSSSYTVNLAGFGSATAQFEGTIDNGTTFVAVKGRPLAGGPAVSSATANGQWRFETAGLRQMRVRLSAFSSGPIVVWINASPGAGASATQDGGGRLVTGNVDRLSYGGVTTEAVGASAKALGAIEADGTNVLRLRYIKICLDPAALQTTAGERTLVLYPTTAASASGSTQTAVPMASGDAAFGGVLRTGALTTTPAIGSVTTANALWSGTIFLPAAATTAVPCVEKAFGTGEGIKPPTTGSAVTSGLALGDLTGGSGGTGNYIITMQWSAEPN